MIGPLPNTRIWVAVGFCLVGPIVHFGAIGLDGPRATLILPPDNAWAESLRLVEPPAGQCAPSLDPLKTLARLLTFKGRTKESALANWSGPVVV